MLPKKIWYSMKSNGHMPFFFNKLGFLFGEWTLMSLLRKCPYMGAPIWRFDCIYF
jgi:hypothetical protein